MTTLIFVRHGQSEANLKRVFAGHTDIPLTEIGRRQAVNTAEFLRTYPIKKIYSSDLMRAMQTAAPTAEMHQLPIIPDERLREIYAGEWEGRAYENLMQEYSEGYRIWREDCGHAHPSGGESVADLAKRIYAETDRIVEENRGSCVAVFSHATPIRTLCARWQGVTVGDLYQIPFVPNASVTVVDFLDDGTHSVRLCGYDAHQGDLSTAFKKGII